MWMPLSIRTPLKTSSHNQQKPSGKWGLQILRDKRIRLIKTLMAGFLDSLVGPCLKRKIGGRPFKDYF